MSEIKGNETVKIHYTGKLNDGQIFDSSLNRGEPLVITLGQGKLIPGLEKGLLNMKVNEKKTITVPKEEAYGSSRKELFQKIPNENLPAEIKPKVGMGLLATNPDGAQKQFRVAEILEDHIVVDGNHPLAGHDLTFELELLEIQ